MVQQHSCNVLCAGIARFPSCPVWEIAVATPGLFGACRGPGRGRWPHIRVVRGRGRWTKGPERIAPAVWRGANPP